MALAIDPLIRLQGISKIFHAEEVETHALSRIELEIRAGEYLAVCGPSGCGKSTLLSILGLLDSPSEGSYVLAGEPVSALTSAQRARVRARAIGFVFQAFNLIGDLTVLQNVELPLRYRGLAADARRAAAYEALERVGLLHRHAPLPGAALGRPAAAGGRRAGGRRPAAGAAGGRAHRQSRLRQRREVMALLHELNAEGATIWSSSRTTGATCARHGRAVYLFDGHVVPGASRDREVA